MSFHWKRNGVIDEGVKLFVVRANLDQWLKGWSRVGGPPRFSLWFEGVGPSHLDLVKEADRRWKSPGPSEGEGEGHDEQTSFLHACPKP
jgi:hypothetical protein